MTNKQRKIAIITGASRSNGIGTAICKALALNGADIFFTHWSRFDETDGNGADRGWPDVLSQELGGYGVRAEHMEADLSDIETPRLLLDRVEETLGAPSILVNNATHCAPTNFRSLTAAALDQHYTVNNRGTILLSTAFAQRFELAGLEHGRIINLVSKGPDPNNLAYTATKGLLIALTEPLSVGLAPLGITVNCVDPGPTDSGWMSEELKEFLLPSFPMGRIGTPEDAARLIAFLASEQAQWVTGQLIKSEGGFTSR